jgi:hypothetical protein
MEGIDTIGFFPCGPSSSVERRGLFRKRYRFFRRGRSGYFWGRCRLWLDELDIFEGS